MNCPICNSVNTTRIVTRNNVPVHQNFLIANQADAENVTRGVLDMHLCDDCIFVFNQQFEPAKLAYGDNYENAQSHSQYFSNYLHDLVNRLVEEEGVRDSKIVEVGCGDGTFMKMLVESEELNNTAIGFDPSYKGPQDLLDGKIRFEKRFYDEHAADTPADVVISRHVIEHVQDPLALLRSVKKALVNHENAKVYFETPCVEWILRNCVFWDFFYEHCSLFSSTSLKKAFELSGFDVTDVTHVFNGQYLWISASPYTAKKDTDSENIKVQEYVREYRECEQKTIANWRKIISKYLNEGPIAIWGAGAKGNTFVNLLDPERKYIDCIIDINPNKQGCFTPGTGHPIVGLSGLGKRNIRNAILMNPNYEAECKVLLENEKLNINLIGQQEME